MPGLGGTRFRRLTGRAAADPAGDARRFQTGLETLETLDAHLAGRDWLVGDGRDDRRPLRLRVHARRG